MATSFTQADVEVLERAIARGELSCVFADRSVMYRSVGDLIKALQYAKAQLADAPPRQSLGVTTKGLD